MKIAVMGFGVVGSGVVEVLINNSESVFKKAGEEINVKYILDIRDFSDSPYADKFIKDFDILLNDSEIEAVCEVIGGTGFAYTATKACLELGKSVITSNKELVATKGPELMKIAKEHNVNYFFEASVGGGIPIIRPLSDSLAGNEITKIVGILNGTTNYILTKMINNGLSFDTVLKQAQELGYAEKNPDADILGIDTCRKIAILSSIGFGKYINPDFIKTKGITKITLEDVKAANQYNSVIKLLGIALMDKDNMLTVRVEPAVLSKNHPLSNVEGVYNAILVTGNALGDVMFYGQGAGKLPTASAVVADLIYSCKHRNLKKHPTWKDMGSDFIVKNDKMISKYLMKFSTDNKQKLISEAKTIYSNLEELSWNIENELIFVTSEQTEAEHKIATDKLSAFGKLITKILVINE